MSSDLYLIEIIQLGHDLTATKYYWCAIGTILFYDYLLTLADEIKYVWSEQKSFGSWLFLLNRYFPVTYQLWQFVVSYGPQSAHITEVCQATAFYPAVSLVVCTLLAQAVFTLRIYGVTLGNIPITAAFMITTAGQFIFGIYVLVALHKTGAFSPPQIPFDAYHICLFNHLPNSVLEGVYAGVPLLFDLLAFTLTLFFVVRSKKAGFGVSTLLKTIAEDATRYFLFISTFQLILVVTLAFYPDSQFLVTSAYGNLVFVPVMISRLFLSLRKAADLKPNEQSLAGSGSFQSMVFSRPQRSTKPGLDEIPLHVYSRVRETSY